MRQSRRQFLAGLSGAALARPARVVGQEIQPIRIGVLGDQTGMSADAAGPGTVAAVQLAINDFGGHVAGRPVAMLVGDMLLKPQVAAQIAAKWFDVDGVDVIIDLPLTSAAVAVLEVAKRRTKPTIITAAASASFTGQYCSPTNIHWTDDTFALGNGTARAVVAQGYDTWFFLTADYAFGTAMQNDATKAIEAAGGKVLGSVRHPLGTSDFSSFIVQAMNSGAKVIGLASVAGDTINAIKQAREFGLDRTKQHLVGFLVFISDIRALGLQVAQGLYVTAGFYWDQSLKSRAFAQRFFEVRGAMPTKSQAASYAATLHYLRAVDRAHSTDGLVVNRVMREIPVDYFGKTGFVRQDGRVMYDLSLYEVKSPAESTKPWDYYKELRKIPAKDAFRSLEDGKCAISQ